MVTQEQARAQVESNSPEVRSGQRWRLDTEGKRSWSPVELRIVCRYPFAKPEDGRTWIAEDVYSVTRLERIPELTLRLLYELVEDVEEV